MEHVVHHGPGRPRAARPADTRDRILRVARDVFSELGYDATTFQEIAQRADLTRPAINHYFASKQVLYEAVLDHAVDLVRAAVERARRETGVIDRVSCYISWLAELEDDDRSTAAFTFAAVLDAERRPDLRFTVGELERAGRDFLAEVLTDAVGSGEITTESDIGSLVETMTAILWGVGFYVTFVGDRGRAAMVAANLRLLLANRLWQLT